jgi:hypothetical protein
MRTYLFADQGFRSARQDDAGVPVIVVLLVALLATMTVRYLNLPLEATFFGLTH